MLPMMASVVMTRSWSADKSGRGSADAVEETPIWMMVVASESDPSSRMMLVVKGGGGVGRDWSDIVEVCE